MSIHDVDQSRSPPPVLSSEPILSLQSPQFSTPFPMSASSQSITSNYHVVNLTSPVSDDGTLKAERPSKRIRYASPDPKPTGLSWQNPAHITSIDHLTLLHPSPHSSPSTVSFGSRAQSPHATPQVSLDLNNPTDQAIQPDEHSEEETETEESEPESKTSANQVLGPEWIAGSEDQAESINEENMSVSDVRNLLERNHMYVDDQGAATRGRSLVQKATAIIDERRLSKMTGKEADDILDTIRFHSTKNEKTLLINLWQLLVKKTRFCKRKLASGEEEILSPEEETEAALWIQKTWRADDKLWTKWDANFFSDTLPEIAETGNHFLDHLLEDVPRVAKPVPDICMGFDKTAFDEEVMSILQRFGFTVTKDQWISIFALEAKGPDEPIAAATNQCCRSGAAMVKRCRDFFKATNAWLSVHPSPNHGGNQATQPAQSSHLQQAAHPLTYPRPDMQSFAFSAALNPEQVILYMHWAEETGPDTEVWQQTRLRDYSLYNTGALELLRCNIDNILDWGIATRRRKVEAQCERFSKHYETLSAGQKTAAGKKAKETVELHVIKRKGVGTAANKKRKTADGESE